MKNVQRVVVLLVGATAISAILYFLVGGVDGGTAPSAHPRGAPLRSDNMHSAMLEEREEAVGASEHTPPLRNAGELLSEFWGERWREMKKAYESHGVDLDRPLSLDPWEEVRPRIKRELMFSDKSRAGYLSSHLRWPEEVTADWLQMQYAVSPEDVDDYVLGEVEHLAEAPNENIRLTCAHMFDLMEVAILQRLEADQVVRAPLTTAVVPKANWENGAAFYSGAAASGGWAVRVSLDDEAYPDIKGLRAQAEAYRIERDRAIASYLRSLSR